MTEKNKIYAVLTGDLVESSTLATSDLRRAMEDIRGAVKRFQKTFPDSVLGELDVYSGDGWQVLMPDWRRSLRAALYLKATMKGEKYLKLDSRVAIAWGNVDSYPINPSRISESTGEAFTESGRALADMSKGPRMRLRAKANMGIANTGILSASVALLDKIVAGWKPAQARAVSCIILGLKQEEAAEELKVSQPTIHRSVTSAGWYPIEQLLDEIEKI